MFASLFTALFFFLFSFFDRHKNLSFPAKLIFVTRSNYKKVKLLFKTTKKL